MKVEGDFIMTEDLNIDEDLIVKGNIYGKNGIRCNINARNITARNIIARNINAWDINASDINALDINAEDINAGDIIVWDINASDINACNINAWDIIAWDICYYAVCFAYNNIKCKRIKGRRENCKQFVLDGEIRIIKDIPEFIEKDGYKYKLMEKEK